jgi:multidrug efflux system membrane fusion protein
MGAAPVVVCEALRRDVPIGLKAIGSVEAIQTVEVRARVGGEISRVAFKRGRDVRRGELLFVIDPRPYEAELRQVEADSARNAARAASAEATALRYADLVEKGYVTRQEYDEAVANAEALRAEVRANQAEIERARLDLGFCSIRSPIDGRAGDLLIHPGNLVQANGEDPLVVIHQLAPVYVSFSVPERRLAEIKKQASAGTLRVEASLPEDSSSTWEGSLTFIDNAVDETTGTILLKATFPNEDRVLWPGQFVDVELTLATRRGALVVPAEAVQSGQQGGYVFVIGPDTTADLRTVRTGPRANGEIVIEEGVEPGEKVVVEGQLRLFPGAKAAVKRTEAPPGATAR